MAYFNYKRRQSSVARIGDTPMGGDFPIRIQSMANVSTMDTDAAVAQAIRMIEAGAEYVRFTAQGEREARNLGEIRERLNERGYTTPLVADIHFNPRAADVAAERVEKVRINPGNYVDKVKTFSHVEYTDEEYAAEIEKIRARFVPFLNVCKAHGTAIRIGVNHGSLSDRIMSRYGDTPEGMVASCMEFLRICRDEDFPDVVISIKASNTVVMVRTVRLLVRTMEAEGMRYPLHLGVTEAGFGEEARIKSAIGIGGATLMEVRGFGRQRGHTEIYRSRKMEVDFRSKMMLEIVMEEEKVERAVAVILEHARTGAVGDGKIFSYEIRSATKIRTGETGYDALQSQA